MILLNTGTIIEGLKWFNKLIKCFRISVYSMKFTTVNQNFTLDLQILSYHIPENQWITASAVFFILANRLTDFTGIIINY